LNSYYIIKKFKKSKKIVKNICFGASNGGTFVEVSFNDRAIMLNQTRGLEKNGRLSLTIRRLIGFI